MNCPRPRCRQLMLRDPDDPAEHKCLSCGASTFRPPPGLAEEPDHESHVHGHRGLTARSVRRDRGLPQGAANAVIRRFM